MSENAQTVVNLLNIPDTPAQRAELIGEVAMWRIGAEVLRGHYLSAAHSSITIFDPEYIRGLKFAMDLMGIKP